MGKLADHATQHGDDDLAPGAHGLEVPDGVGDLLKG